MSELQLFFEKILATPVMELVASIVGTLITFLVLFSKIKTVIGNLTITKKENDDLNVKLEMEIQKLNEAKEELENAKENLEKTRKEYLTLVNDIKSIKLAFRLLAKNNTIAVSNGTAKRVVDILKEEGVRNETKQG